MLAVSGLCGCCRCRLGWLPLTVESGQLVTNGRSWTPELMAAYCTAVLLRRLADYIEVVRLLGRRDLDLQLVDKDLDEADALMDSEGMSAARPDYVPGQRLPPDRSRPG